jgi:LPXTG-motif cell wall-anchored protein
VHDLQDAPDYCPAHRVEAGDHLYRDDWDFENDNDWYVFDAVAGQTYTVQTSELETRADTILALHASDCATLLEENDDVFWPQNVASRIVWTAPDNGAYCVMVRSFDWRVYGESTGYTFSVTLGTPATGMDVAPTGDNVPIKPLPPPTPEPGSGRSSVRPPGKASILPQKPPPEPTPVKPVPQPTPRPAPSQPQPGGSGSGSDLASAGPASTDPVLLPQTGSRTGASMSWVFVAAGLLFAAGGGWMRWRKSA